MKAEDIKLEHIVHIHGIYRAVGGNKYRSDMPQRLYDRLRKAVEGDKISLHQLKDGARYGSKYGSSKLVVDIKSDGTISVHLNANVDTSIPCGAELIPKAEQAEEKFLELVDQYFAEIGQTA